MVLIVVEIPLLVQMQAHFSELSPEGHLPLFSLNYLLLWVLLVG